jgi:hypothetical protein
MLNIDRTLCSDLDLLGFTNVAKRGWSKYKLPIATLAKQCELWIQRQLALARVKARYDHGEEDNVEFYKEQLAQCRSMFSKRVSARLMAEHSELLPFPDLPKHNESLGTDLRFGKDLVAWAEHRHSKIVYIYHSHVSIGIFLTVTTNREQLIIEHEVIGALKKHADLDAVASILISKKKLTYSMFEDAIKACKANRVEARVADEPDNLLPNSSFNAAGLRWDCMESIGTTWYDAKVRNKVFVSVLVSEGAISDAFLSIDGTLRNEDEATRLALLEFISSSKAPTIKNLEAVVKLLLPKRTATARVSGERSEYVPQHDFEHDGRFWTVENNARTDLYKCRVSPNNWLVIEVGDDKRIHTAWLEDAMMRVRRVKALDKINQFLSTRRYATFDSFEALMKIAISAGATLSMIGASLTPALAVVQARFAGEVTDVTFKTLPDAIKLGSYDLKLSSRTPYDVTYESNVSRITLEIDDGGSVAVEYRGNRIPRDNYCDRIGEFDHETLFKFPMPNAEFNYQLARLGRRIEKYVREVQMNERINKSRRDAYRKAWQKRHGVVSRVASEQDKFNDVNELPERIEVNGEFYNDTGAFKSQVVGTFRTYRSIKKLGGKSITLNIYNNGEITAHLLTGTLAAVEHAVTFPAYKVELQRDLDAFGKMLKQRLAHEGWD